MKKFRESHSACSLYALVDQNMEYFMPADEEDEDNLKRPEKCKKLIEKVSCPLHIKVEKKVYSQDREGKSGGADGKLKKKLFERIARLYQNSGVSIE